MQDLNELKHVFLICAEFEVKQHQWGISLRSIVITATANLHNRF